MQLLNRMTRRKWHPFQLRRGEVNIDLHHCPRGGWVELKIQLGFDTWWHDDRAIEITNVISRIERVTLKELSTGTGLLRKPCGAGSSGQASCDYRNL